MEGTNAMELAKTFYQGFILRHGVPEVCLQDNGTSFASEFNNEMSKFVGIELQFSPPYVAPFNGLVERFMKTLRQMILIYCNQDNIKDTWDTHLRLIRFMYNNMYHSSIEKSPFELVRGRRDRHPTFITDVEDDIKLPAGYRNTDTPQFHFAKVLMSKLNDASQVVYQEIKKYGNDQEYHTFKQGDKVLTFNMKVSSTPKPRKLAFDWYGPLVIESSISNTRFNLKYWKEKFKHACLFDQAILRMQCTLLMYILFILLLLSLLLSFTIYTSLIQRGNVLYELYEYEI